MIESGMVPVIIPGDDFARQWIEKLAQLKVPSGLIARKLQSYIVQVPIKARQRLLANGRAKYMNPEFRADQFLVLTDEPLYQTEFGLLWEDADYLSTEALVN